MRTTGYDKVSAAIGAATDKFWTAFWDELSKGKFVEDAGLTTEDLEDFFKELGSAGMAVELRREKSATLNGLSSNHNVEVAVKGLDFGGSISIGGSISW